MSIRTPMGRARGMGAAGHGVGEFWHQRVTSVTSLVLAIGMIFILLTLATSTYAEVRATFANPLVGGWMALTVISFVYHMYIGAQEVIMEYGPKTWKLGLTLANTGFCLMIAAACLFALIKMSFGVL
ncbi:succinate dehydrogenase, hydrophobic membrane anchor protein [Consotaella salsifontis]|uniref:Succinate dehydrogenase hydrophobic membrane anchor subunit n=1 Tax=Consotaella salsifontis TaxID=1365950 RepID=A0A1T4RXI1_9HYPH|nr:succinate dehydrogenase, hydrophobic membrane anchor protein [Consotaella salsifontis]SKA20704.1 succinate dehydrogenase subunit D [Consotaella salsifontis]